MPPSEQFSIKRVAELARIYVSDEQADSAQQQISQILNLIDVLDELDLEQVQPFFGLDFAHTDDHSPQRDDQTGSSTPVETILANAPNQDGEYYKVPPVF